MVDKWDRSVLVGMSDLENIVITQSHISCVVKSHLSRYANLEEIFSFCYFRIRIVLLEGLEYLLFSSGISLVRFPTGYPIDGVMLQGVLILK